MESKRTSTTYFIPPGKFLLMENALGNPDLIQSSVSSDCRVTIVDTANFPLDELEQWPTFRLTSSDVKLKLGEGLYYVYIVVPTPDNTDTSTAFISYNTVQVDRKGYDADGKLLGKEKFCYYQCGTVSARGGHPSATTTPSGQGRLIEVDLGVTPAPSTLPGGLNDFDNIFQLDKVEQNNPKSWLLTILATVREMTARLVRITGSLVFGSGESEKMVTDVALSAQAADAESVSDTILPTTAWVDARFLVLDDRFLRKDQDDHTPHSLSVGKDLSAQGFLNTAKGLKVGQFASGTLGSGAAIYVDEYGNTHGEVDFWTVRRKAMFNTITIQELKHIGGELVLSAAYMVCSGVEELVDGWKCYFNNINDDGRRIYNYFEVDDQARCQTFDLSQDPTDTQGNHYYWRLVTAIGDDFIVLSKTDCDTNSDVPEAGDNIVLLGNRSNVKRQSATVLSAYGEDAPSFKQYKGINRYSLVGKEVTILSDSGNLVTGDFLSTSGKNLASEIERLQVDLNKVSEQVDTEFTMWFFDYDPTLTNYPSSEWVTENMLLNHVEDLFYNTATGKAYRFVNEDGYKWKIVTDMQTVKALEDAAIANKYATEANVRLNNIVSDGMLSSVEKKEVLKEWQSVAVEYARNEATAVSFGMDFNDHNGEYYKYWNAYWHLGYYLNGNSSLTTGATPAWLQDLGTDQPIDGDTYRSKWNGYYDARAAIVNKFSELAEQKADEAKKDVDAIAADNILSKAEKKEVLREWETITSTYASHVANAGTYGVSVSELKAAYEALGTYLNAGIPWNVGGGVPLWLGTLKGSNTDIDGTTYRAKWVAYYDAETALLDAISTVINDKASQAASGGLQNWVGTQPTPPYNRGDRWCQATYGTMYDNDDLVCVTAKAQGESFAIGDWEPASYAKTKVIKETVSELTYLLGAFEKDASGNAILKKEAGVKVTQEMATIFASKTELNTATNAINASIAGVQTTANQALVYAQKTVYNDDGTVKNIDKSGLMLEKDFASMYSQAVAADGTIMKKAEMTAYVQKNADGELESGVKITADNVNINGFVNVGGNKMTIGGFSIESDKLTVSTPLEGDAFVSGSYTTMLDGSGIDVNIGNGLITSRIGLDYFTDVDTQYFTMVNVDNNQPTGGRRIDRVCALRANLLDDDYGLLINGGATHILSSGITRLNGLTLNTRVVTSNYAPEENDDILVVNAEGAVTITLSSTIPIGKVYFIKAKTGFGLTLSGYLRASNGSSYENTTISIGGKSCIVVHTDAAWTVYNCE